MATDHAARMKGCAVNTTAETTDVRVVEAQPDDEPQRLQQAKMATLGELAAGILHEINNPLSFIQANLKNLLKFSARLIELVDSCDRVALSDEARAELAARKNAAQYEYLRTRITEMIESSLAGTERMNRIILDYKSFSRVSDAGFAHGDIEAAIDSTLVLLHHEYRDRITISKRYGIIPPVRCSIARLNQVFMNLLVNAIQAITGPGEIEIITGHNAGMVTIAIRDTGCGMPDAVRAKIFDPFFTTKPDGVGTGLGLSIIDGIMKQHHGQISVESTPGAGTTFTLTLPVDLKDEDVERPL